MKRIMLLVLVGLVTVGSVMSVMTVMSVELVNVPNRPNCLNRQNPYQEEYEQMLYPTVRITAGMATGSGVVIDVTKVTTVTKVTGCYIITAAHVVDNQSVVNVELYDSRVISASVVITDTAKDLALLRVLCDSVAKASLVPKDYTPYLFSPVWAVGCSLGLPPRPSQGIITAINKDSWEVSSPILPGNSGGPVYDAKTYEVIGITVWVRVYQGQLVTTMAGIVPINQIYNFIEEVDSKQKTVDSKNH